ncbi:hypothetical protein B0H14DRAFT_2655916 [Mycena olivaceomarginata]|nr:hypothetical protein B0H14DRAFT_2655916 [Mycena olivaceomarginata]
MGTEWRLGVPVSFPFLSVLAVHSAEIPVSFAYGGMRGEYFLLTPQIHWNAERHSAKSRPRTIRQGGPVRLGVGPSPERLVFCMSMSVSSSVPPDGSMRLHPEVPAASMDGARQTGRRGSRFRLLAYQAQSVPGYGPAARGAPLLHSSSIMMNSEGARSTRGWAMASHVDRGQVQRNIPHLLTAAAQISGSVRGKPVRDSGLGDGRWATGDENAVLSGEGCQACGPMWDVGIRPRSARYVLGSSFHLLIEGETCQAQIVSGYGPGARGAHLRTVDRWRLGNQAESPFDSGLGHGVDLFYFYSFGLPEQFSTDPDTPLRGICFFFFFLLLLILLVSLKLYQDTARRPEARGFAAGAFRAAESVPVMSCGAGFRRT